MKQLIGLVRLAALTAICGAHRKTEATQNCYPKKPDHRVGLRNELVLLDLDGTVIAREINLWPQGT